MHIPSVPMGGKVININTFHLKQKQGNRAKAKISLLATDVITSSCKRFSFLF